MKKTQILKALSKTNYNHLSQEQISWLSQVQISWLSQVQISWLSQVQISWLSQEQIRGLSQVQISWLSQEQIRGLSQVQISWLSQDQIRGLSQEQIRGLSQVQIDCFITSEKIPVHPNFYTNLKNGFDSKKIVYKQSTFGDYTEFSENVTLNECGIAMCIGGYASVAGGILGFNLCKNLGYVLGATLMHRKTYGEDVPVFNYMSAENSDGILFIEMMSEFEQRDNQDLKFSEWLDLELKKDE
jgi:hypothetical protein